MSTLGWWTLQCTLRSGKNCLVEQWTRPLLHYEEEEGDGKEEEEKEKEEEEEKMYIVHPAQYQTGPLEPVMRKG